MKIDYHSVTGFILDCVGFFVLCVAVLIIIPFFVVFLILDLVRSQDHPNDGARKCSPSFTWSAWRNAWRRASFIDESAAFDLLEQDLPSTVVIRRVRLPNHGYCDDSPEEPPIFLFLFKKDGELVKLESSTTLLDHFVQRGYSKLIRTTWDPEKPDLITLRRS